MSQSVKRSIVFGTLMLLLPGVTIAQCPDTAVIHTGEATYYTFADGGGACLFDPTPQDLMVGAMNQVDYDGSQVCGECVSLTGPNATILIRIVDLCPGCKQGDIDLSPLAFSRIADTALGRVPIRWQVVPCAVAGPIIYHFKDGSNQWWTAIQIRNHVNPILSLEYLTGQGIFKSVNRVNYNYFVEQSGMGPGPYTFRVTDVYGHTLIDSGIVGGDNTSAPGHAQFPTCPFVVVPPFANGQRKPVKTLLDQNYPNPFNSSTIIGYQLSEAGDVKLVIYDVLGRQAAVLVNERKGPGRYQVGFDGSNLASGMYIYRLIAGGFVQSKRLLLVR
jgi:expansin (peptidoglycan-binding protein)